MAVAMLERKGFSKEDFTGDSPGGKLGQMLMRGFFFFFLAPFPDRQDLWLRRRDRREGHLGDLTFPPFSFLPPPRAPSAPARWRRGDACYERKIDPVAVSAGPSSSGCTIASKARRMP